MTHEDTVERYGLELNCWFCKQMFGYLILKNEDEMADAARTLNDYGSWPTCIECSNKHNKGTRSSDMTFRMMK